jgi:glycosyltransferase involved in cell wall biosynthesis
MRVLILTQHFAPEVTAGRFRVEAFAVGIRERGHDVRVICPVPNHPRGVVAAGYGHRLVDRRRVEGFDVSYVRVAASPEKTFRTRLSYYGSYAAMAAALGVAERRQDVVLASSPPLTVTAAGSLLATRHRAPLVLDIRDLWPDSALDLGELRPGRVVAAMRRLERHAYAKAAAIVTANDAFRERIELRSPAGRRVEVVPNGTTREWIEIGRSEVARAAVGLPEGEFVWAYAGNIGLAHGLEVAADAAERLGDGYRLLVIGEGPRRAELARRAAYHDPPRIELRGLMPPTEAARHLRAADVLLVSERQTETVSAKLYDVCAVGRPVVAACRGELRRVIEREEIALAVPHGDPEAMAAAVRQLRSDPELGARLTARARDFAQAHLRERQAERVADLVESVARTR